MDQLHEKLEDLKLRLRSLGSIAIAFSGGVDSTFLVKVAYEELGENAVAVTARSSTFPMREFDEAAAFAASLGIRHISCTSEELDIDGFSSNPPNRCYLCKRELMTKIKVIADQNSLRWIAEGSNLDDDGDFRPGLQAILELGVKSPLRESRLTKDDIRQLSKELGLSTWDKPSFACLSSRFPYGESITTEKLAMVDQAEQFLLDLGFKQVRVRSHGNLARIELEDIELGRLLDSKLRQAIHDRLKAIGYSYISLDLKGYRTGSMNEVLTSDEMSGQSDGGQQQQQQQQQREAAHA